MSDIKDSIRQKLSSATTPDGGTIDTEVILVSQPKASAGWDNPVFYPLEEPARRVISAYQNANKWLDTLKEHILINLHCPYFSEIVHDLAHTMPVRFDRFGDILHKENLLIPYPTTEEWTAPIGDANSCIQIIYSILDDIQAALKGFKIVAEENNFYLAHEVDNLISDIAGEYAYFYRIEGALEHERNLAQWDILCCRYRNL